MSTHYILGISPSYSRSSPFHAEVMINGGSNPHNKIHTVVQLANDWLTSTGSKNTPDWIGEYPSATWKNCGR